MAVALPWLATLLFLLAPWSVIWCCCAGGTGCSCATIEVTVTDNCTGAPIAGAPVTCSLTGHPTVSGTTDSFGVWSGCVTAAGSWTVACGSGRWVTQSTTVNVSACDGSTHSTAFALKPNFTNLPFTIHGSAGGFTWTLTKSGSTWTQTQFVAIAGKHAPGALPPCGATATIPMSVTVSINGAGCFVVKQDCALNFGCGGCDFNADIGGGNPSTVTASSRTVDPVMTLSGTFSGSYDTPPGGGCPSPPLAGAFSFTE
jgi:hypothetical protein